MVNPVVISTNCVRLKSKKALCQACVDACPQNALSVSNNNQIVIDNSQCDQCGRCILACPVMAIEGEIPQRKIDGSAIYALGVKPTSKELLLYYQQGCRQLIVASQDSDWLAILSVVNQTLTHLALAPYSVVIDSALLSNQTQQETVSKSRRAFLRLSAIHSRQKQPLIINQPLVNVLPNTQFFQVTLDSEKCSLCSACLHLCPTHALKYENQSFVLDQVNCVGCNVCQDTCPEQALAVTAEIKPKTIVSHPFKMYICSDCKQHYLSVSAHSGRCSACRIKQALNLAGSSMTTNSFNFPPR